jgi:3-oxoacyl-[acyl-carrier-protein] synthase III
MRSVFINSIGKFLPGNPIDNDQIEGRLGQINGRSSRAKHRILSRNGIKQRYYALDEHQNVTHSNSQMAAYAIRDALSHIDVAPSEIDLLCAATTWPDQLVPGFASMVHGELPELPPLEILSAHGVCSSSVSALKYAVSQIQLGEKHRGVVAASELASRLFIHTRFEAETSIRGGGTLPFDVEFLRWMLSDGAGAMVVENRPNQTGLSLKVEWIELISHANAYPPCMYAGVDITAQKSWLNYPSFVAAAEAGAIDLTQNTRLLDNIVKLGVAGWVKLVDHGRFKVDEIDWFVCHYSSHFFRSQIVELLEKAGCLVPEEKWFTNLYTRGNTGCSSMYLMLEELFHSGRLKPGQKIACLVPESGRFTTAYFLLTVVGEGNNPQPAQPDSLAQQPVELPVSPNEPTAAYLQRKLALVWFDFENRMRLTPIVRKLNRQAFTVEDYKALLRNLRPQVVEGSRWITRAASNMTHDGLRSLFIAHAHDEHRDYQMLEKNYVAVGGALEEIIGAQKNLGGEALSAFIFNQGSRENPIDLIGSVFIIERAGSQIAGQWADKIKKDLNLQEDQVSFFSYHGKNDASHLDRWNDLFSAEWMTREVADRIIKTAQVTARLYLMQLEEIQ